MSDYSSLQKVVKKYQLKPQFFPDLERSIKAFARRHQNGEASTNPKKKFNPTLTLNSREIPQIIQAASQPFRFTQKAYVCGDVLEVNSYYDEEGRPLSFLAGFSLDKGVGETIDDKVLDAFHIASDDWIDKYVIRYLAKHPDQGILAVLDDFEPDESDPGTVVKRELTPEEQERNRQKSLTRAKNNARRIIQKYRFDMMWTFTFDPGDVGDFGIYRSIPVEEQRERKAVLAGPWNTFMTQLRKYCQEHAIPLEWLKVLELHNSDVTCDEKRGTYHIHFVTKLRIDKHLLQKMWGYGVIWFTDYRARTVTDANGHVKNIDFGVQRDPAFYACKYIDKDFDEARKHKEKAYTTSQNVHLPNAKFDEEIAEIKKTPMKAFDLEGMHPAILKALKQLKDLNEVKVQLPDIGYGPGRYRVEYTRIVDGEERTAFMYKQLEIYDARLLLPEYKAEYLARLKRREAKAHQQQHKKSPVQGELWKPSTAYQTTYGLRA